MKLLQLFGELHAGQLELLRINIGEIILLQKINNMERIEQFKPICLLIVFLIFTKTATVRLNSVDDQVVRPTQTTFMKGRYIIDDVVTLHETIHELHHKKLSGQSSKLTLKRPMIRSSGLFCNKLSE
jgi:hypothetical protein